MHSRAIIAAVFVAVAYGQVNPASPDLNALNTLLAAVTDLAPQIASATGAEASIAAIIASNSENLQSTLNLLATATPTDTAVVSGTSVFNPATASVTATDSTSSASVTSSVAISSTTLPPTSSVQSNVTMSTASKKSASSSTIQPTSTSKAGAAPTEAPIKYAGLVVAAGLALVVL